MFALPQLMQKIRRQERGHEAAERMLIDLGARAPWAGERPADWLAHALVAIRARYAQHPGCHRFIEPRNVSQGCEVTR
jgi:hypothetical protein